MLHPNTLRLESSASEPKMSRETVRHCQPILHRPAIQTDSAGCARYQTRPCLNQAHHIIKRQGALCPCLALLYRRFAGDTPHQNIRRRPARRRHRDILEYVSVTLIVSPEV